MAPHPLREVTTTRSHSSPHGKGASGDRGCRFPRPVQCRGSGTRGSSSWPSVRTRSAADVYALLLDALAVEVPAEEGSKPPCCDELGKPPPTATWPKRWQRPFQRFLRGPPPVERRRGHARKKPPGTIKTRVNNVRSVLRAAVRDRAMAVDPSDGVRLPRDRRRDAAMALPTVEQVGKIMTAAEPPFRALVALAAFAGLRLGEAAGVQVL